MDPTAIWDTAPGLLLPTTISVATPGLPEAVTDQDEVLLVEAIEDDVEAEPLAVALADTVPAIENDIAVTGLHNVVIKSLRHIKKMG